MKKKISITDLALSLGVSKTLVSLVLNGKGDQYGINSDTQERVLKAATEMNYSPSQIARGFRTGKSNTVGLVVADISNPFYAKIARQIEDALEQSGYNLIICSSDEDEEKELKLITMLRDRQVDGLIISSTLSSSTIFSELKRANYPFVLIDRYFPRVDANHVVIDNYKGAYDAVTHLLKIGYKKIAHLTISPSHITTLKDRASGYKDALKAFNVRYNRKLDREIDFNNLHENLKFHLDEILSDPDEVQALFFANNKLAVASLDIISEKKLMIPRDIAIVSFDDIPLFAYCYSPITAVSQPIDEIGKNSVEVLLKDIEQKGTAPKVRISLEPELIVRHSCGRLSRRS